MLNLYSASTVQPWTMSEFFSHRTYNQSFLGGKIYIDPPNKPRDLKPVMGDAGRMIIKTLASSWGVETRMKLTWQIKCKLDHATIWFKHGNPSHFSHDKIHHLLVSYKTLQVGGPICVSMVIFQPLTLIAALMYCCNYPEDHTVMLHGSAMLTPSQLKRTLPK